MHLAMLQHFCSSVCCQPVTLRLCHGPLQDSLGRLQQELQEARVSHEADKQSWAVKQQRLAGVVQVQMPSLGSLLFLCCGLFFRLVANFTCTKHMLPVQF